MEKYKKYLIEENKSYINIKRLFDIADLEIDISKFEFSSSKEKIDEYLSHFDDKELKRVVKGNNKILKSKKLPYHLGDKELNDIGRILDYINYRSQK